MKFNVPVAVKWIEDNTTNNPKGECALRVRQACNAGGLNVAPAGYAGNYGPNLVTAGFLLIEECPADSGDSPWTTVFQAGDVVIYEEDASKGEKYKWGHAQMNTGKTGFRKEWISDFKQAGFWCYSQTRLALRIYRHSNLLKPQFPPLPECGGPLPKPPPLRGPATINPGPTNPGSPAAAPAYPGHSVRYGSRGTNVVAVQQQLTAVGYPLTDDGIFGHYTKSTVAAYQTTNGLMPDGIVGPLTWGVLFG